MSEDDGMLDGDEMRAWLQRFAERVLRDVETLTELDRLAGDGDFGWNISTALERVLPQLDRAGGPSPLVALEVASEAFLGGGGTSGALYGLWFGRLAKGPDAPWGSSDLAMAVGEATAAVQRLGRASVGHKTMVDAMAPAADSLAGATALPWRSAVDRAAVAAAAGARSTEDVTAARGRASYVGERSRGVVDPGALAIAWFFAAGRDEVTS